MTLGNRVKTVFVSCAVIVALLGVLLPHPAHHSVPRVAPAFVPAIALISAPDVNAEGELLFSISNVVLVDARRKLYLGVAHGVTVELALIFSRQHGIMRAIAPLEWRNELADLAIVQAITPYDLADITPLLLDPEAPGVGTAITLYGYCPVSTEDGVFKVMSTQRQFVVVKSAADTCSNEKSCAARDDLVAQLLEGKQLTPSELVHVYPRFVYAILRTNQTRGFEYGLSGSPALGPRGTVIGFASHFAPFHGPYEQAGRYGYFSPASMAIPLLARAQADVDAGRVP
jgi:hypothetical protein